MRELPPDFPKRPPPPGEALVLLGRIADWGTGTDRLSGADRERLRAIAHGRAAEAFIAGRSLLRAALAALLARPPGEIGLAFGRHQKPALADRGGLFFNLTHSDEHLALALSSGAEIGLDIEPAAPPEREAVAEVVMTPEELALFRGLPPERRDEAFLTLWTRKEAVLKAAGSGFSVDPSAFSVGFGPLAPAVLTLPGYDGRFAVSDVRRDGWPPMGVALWNRQIDRIRLLHV